MLEMLVVALLQSLAGQPAMPTSPPAPAAQADGAIGATAPDAAEAPAAPTDDAPAIAPEAAAPAPAPQTRMERRCVEVMVSGRRLPRRECRMVEVTVEPGPAQ